MQGHLISQGVFKVDVLGLPPAEDRDSTLQALGITNVFGEEFRPHHLLKMAEMEQQNESQMIVIISEIHLDKPLVMEKLQKVFEGFENNEIYPLYILIGSFFSKYLYRSNGGKQIMKSCFQELGNMIAQYPNQIEQSKFLFVPGKLFSSFNIFLFFTVSVISL